jgi:DNA processing protein
MDELFRDTHKNCDELDYWLRLVRVPGMHAATLANLLAHFGSLAEIDAANSAALIEAGISAEVSKRFEKFDSAQLRIDRRWVETPGNAFIPWGSPQYPRLLEQLHGAPVGLFVRGNVAALGEPQLAVVGARNPTSIGRGTAHAFASHLSGCGLVITSGLAAGIDAAAHQGALHGGGTTIAVCATGLDTVYPADHRALAESICEHGALVSEFPPNTPPLKFHFPRRNRLISGLSLGTLVVEAAIRSGSLITAKFAADQGREVFAIPGSIHNPLARGCHQLLREGAKLVESAADILAELGPLAAVLRDHRRSPRLDRTENSAPQLDKEYKILLDALGFEPTSVDQMVARTGLKTEEVGSMLLILELDGRVESNPGALYSLVPAAR